MPYPSKNLLNQAVAHRRASQWEESVRSAEDAFVCSLEENSVERLVESLLVMGHSYREMSDVSVAIEYYNLAHTVASLHANAGQASRSLNGKAIVLQQQGDMDAAEAAYKEAIAIADEIGDDRTIANIELNLGTLQTVRGDIASATRWYQASLDRYERLHDERGVLGALNNLGMLYIDSGDLSSADRSLSRAAIIARNLEDTLNEGVVQINRTELLIRRGDLDGARQSCDAALAVFCRLDDHAGVSEARKQYGIIFRETNQLTLAEMHLHEAITIAAKHANPLQEAEAQRELALVFRDLGRNREALAALNRAHFLFSLLQASVDKADISRRLSQLEADFLEVVSKWGESIDETDHYTSGHCHRVAKLTRLMAETLAIHQGELVWLTMGAFLHDVGKIAVSETILKKPGGLSPEERREMESHTLLGEELLASLDFPWDVPVMARSHHERWDGSGYPDRLAGTQIPLPARILHIADVFDALTTSRTYRSPLRVHEALDLMRGDIGSFDPELFTIFESLCSGAEVRGIVNSHSQDPPELAPKGLLA